MDSIAVYFVGTAGSGKSTLCGAFAQWCRNLGIDVMTVNLDPGAEDIPYEPDIDIRQWIDLTQVMQEYHLGPNGAQIVAADLLSANLPKITKELEGVNVNYILVDTPGQLELFSFRQSSRVLVDSLAPDRSALVYIFDVFNTHDIEGLITQVMLSATVQFRFMLPAINVLTKVDLIEEDHVDRVLKWASNPDLLYDESILKMETTPSPSMVLSHELFKVLNEQGVFSKLAPISAPNMVGLDAIYRLIQGTYMAGEDIGSNSEE